MAGFTPLLRNIAISGKIAVGSTTLARALASQLHWNLREANQMFRDVSMQMGFDLEKSPQQYGDEIDRKIDEETVSVCQSRARVIVVSKLVGFLSCDLPGTLRVLVICDDKTRIGRYATNRGYQKQEAAVLLRARERKDQEKFARLYGKHDFFHPSYFQLVLDSAALSIPEEVNRIRSELQK